MVRVAFSSVHNCVQVEVDGPGVNPCKAAAYGQKNPAFMRAKTGLT
jgi:hypothetical protein